MAASAKHHWAKIAGMVILLLPVAVLTLFAVGETIGGDISGLGHLIQVVPLVVVALVAWRWPMVGGLALIGMGSLLAVIYPLRAAGGLPAGSIVFTELILFVPPIVAGFLFLRSAQNE